MPSRAGQWPAPPTLNLQGNGAKQKAQGQTRRALMREAADYASTNGLDVSPVGIRRAVSGYQSSSERETYTMSQWLEVRSKNPTLDTAAFRVDEAARRRRQAEVRAIA